MNQVRSFVVYHIREAIVEALAGLTGNESLYRRMRARSRLRLITMSEVELQELSQLVSQYTHRDSEIVYKKLKEIIAESKRTADDWLKDLKKSISSSEEGIKSKQVLIIENEPSLREELVFAFYQAGFLVSAVTDFYNAFLKLHELKIDLIIMESFLPSDDGFEICRDFHNIFNVPIILLGQDSRDEVWEKVMEAGADHYEVKPCKYLALVARAKAILRRLQLATIIHGIDSVCGDR